MASTETRTEVQGPGPQSPATFDGVLGSADHKTIGRLFIGAGTIGAIAGLLLAAGAAFEAVDLGGFTVAKDADEFTQIWSAGRDLLMFGGIVPILVGLALYIVPLQVGAPSIAFPRGAAGSFWTWLLGSGLLIGSYLLNGGPGGGRADFVVLWAAALAMMVGALVWAMVCIATTVLGVRTIGMTLERVPHGTWSFFVFSLVGLFSLPILMAELLLAYLRVRYLHLDVTLSEELTAIMDGVSYAPAIYWVAIPVLGIAADIVGVHTGRPVKFHKAAMATIGAFGIFSFGADVVGLASLRPVDFNNGFLVAGLLIASVPVLATLFLLGDSIRFGELKMRAPLFGALVSGLLLLAGTATSILGLVEPIMGIIDRNFYDGIDMTQTLVLNGTTFHEGIRAVVIGAAVVAAMAGVQHWGANLFGRRLAEPMGMLAMLLTAVGSVAWAAGEVLAGVADQPQLPSAELAGSGVEGFNSIAALGTAVMTAGVVVFGLNLASTALATKPAGSTPNQWTGSTLEWATTMPPPVGNFPAAPVVTSATPRNDGEITFSALLPSAAEALEKEETSSSEELAALPAGSGGSGES